MASFLECCINLTKSFSQLQQVRLSPGREVVTSFECFFRWELQTCKPQNTLHQHPPTPPFTYIPPPPPRHVFSPLCSTLCILPRFIFIFVFFALPFLIICQIVLDSCWCGSIWDLFMIMWYHFRFVLMRGYPRFVPLDLRPATFFFCLARPRPTFLHSSPLLLLGTIPFLQIMMRRPVTLRSRVRRVRGRGI